MQRDLLNDGLRHAVDVHFCKLFEVLIVDPSPAALERFRAGLHRLVTTEKSVATIIREGDLE